jgi:hypothetical protein
MRSLFSLGLKIFHPLSALFSNNYLREEINFNKCYPVYARQKNPEHSNNLVQEKNLRIQFAWKLIDEAQSFFVCSVELFE